MQLEVTVKYHSAAVICQMFPAMHYCGKIRDVCLANVSQAFKIHQVSDVPSLGQVHGSAALTYVEGEKGKACCRLLPQPLQICCMSLQMVGFSIICWYQSWQGIVFHFWRMAVFCSSQFSGWSIAAALLHVTVRATLTAWLYCSSCYRYVYMSNRRISVVHRMSAHSSRPTDAAVLLLLAMLIM